MKVVVLLILVGVTATLIPSSSAANATERCHPQDKTALLQIKQNTFNNSILIDSWDPTTDCCGSWLLVRCDDSSNRVTELTLWDINTGAPLASGLGNLPYLEVISYHNNATGPIPASFANLRRLISLTLSYNSLTGPIPSFFSTFPKLYSLDLSNNLLSGSIPPALALVPTLANIDLTNNRLTGRIPESFGRLKSEKIELLLSDNKLSGEIPSSIGRVKLYSLHVARNKLKGDVSFLFRKRNPAWELDLSFNSFSFDMSDLEIPNMMNWLDLRHNRIYGSLPEGLAHDPSLAFFNVSYNRLCGRIPTGGTLNRFDSTCYIRNKCLCGAPLPACK